MLSSSISLMTLGTKDEKKHKSLFCCSPQLLVAYCLAVLLGRIVTSYLPFKAQIRIVMVPKYLKLGFSQNITLFESL